MLTLRFSAEDLARTRFAWSPLQEVATSVLTLKDPGRHALHLGWARETRSRLAAAGVGRGLLDALVPFPAVAIPDFLTPVPMTQGSDLETELAALTATSAATVRADLAGLPGPLPPLLRELHRDPAAGLSRLAAEIRAHWAVAIEPHWPRMQRLLEGEILHRGRLMARGGAAELFGDLHPQVAWADGTLRVKHTYFSGDRALDAGDGLVLVPSVFAWPGVFSQSRAPGHAALVYPARGIATLWERRADVAPAALAAVFGRSRARLLAELGSPASTTELAARTGMPAPTVSHHLTVLRDAGLAVSVRSGRSVLYLRSPVAEGLRWKDSDSRRRPGTAGSVGEGTQ